MNSYSQSGPSSGVPSISDLDGYTIRDFNFPGSNSYLPADQDEFGFDPPEERGAFGKLQQHLSPADSTASPLSEWPEFERDQDNKQRDTFDSTRHLDRLLADSLPSYTTAVSRHGQVTPPRTDSSGSVEPIKHESQSPTSKGSERPRRKTKATKDTDQPTASASARKKKNTKKAAANVEANDNVDDSKRKASLEKNRLAAAKCRINKKDKTEQLQQDSHDKAIHNAYLRNEIARMSEEVRRLNSVLLAHAGCEGCKSPGEIQNHLQELGAEFLPGGPGFNNMQMDGLPHSHQGQMASYFDMAPQDSTMLNPPLPEFNRSGDFEVHTPMEAD